MTNTIEPKVTASTGRKLSTISADGKRESFANHAGLYRNTSSGVFFCRFKINGEIKQMSLETTDKVTAVRKLSEAKAVLQNPKNNTGKVSVGIELFTHETNTAHHLSTLSRAYRLRCLDRIVKSWKGLPDREAKSLTVQELQVWAMGYRKPNGEPYAAQFFNNSVTYFRNILAHCGIKRDDNPAFKVKRRGIPPKKLELPTVDQFNKILALIETAGAEQSKDRADYVRFLAFSGCRWAEAKQVKWKDIDFIGNTISVQCGKRRATSSESRTRLVPIMPAMKQLLTRLAAAEPKPTMEDVVCKVVICKKPLVRACRLLGIAPLTHHSMRHLFATFCIEGKVDVPTVSRWLGHSDGGALAMKTYGHPRQEHSQRMAQGITFGLIAPPVEIAELKSANELQPV